MTARHIIPFYDAEDPAEEPGPDFWEKVKPARVDRFLPMSASKRPVAEVRLAWNGWGFHGVFDVLEDGPRSLRTGRNAPVYKDSCVEFFVTPDPAGGYFNFEWNAGGHTLAGFVADHTRTPDGIRGMTLLKAEFLDEVRVRSTQPPVFDHTGLGETRWRLSFSIPFALLARFVRFRTPVSGTTWRCNFYKCGDDTASPHWASFAELPEKNFHLPDKFAFLEFGDLDDPRFMG